MSIPRSARLLLVGHNSCALDCILALAKRGAQRITLLDNAVVDANLVQRVSWLASRDVGLAACQALQKRASEFLNESDTQCQIDLDTRDPTEVLKAEPAFGEQFDIVITTDQPRPVEESFGASQWHERYLIISRNDGFNSKMRSQYRIHTVTEEDGHEIPGRDLHVHPEDLTAEKCQRVAHAMRDAFSSTASSAELGSFLLLVGAAAQIIESHHQQSSGSPESTILQGRESEVLAQAQELVADSGVGATPGIEDIQVMCERGWGAHSWTAKIFGEMMALEAAKLLSKTGRPINSASIDLMARSSLKHKE